MIDLEVRNIAHLGGDAIRDRAFSVTVAHEQDPLHDGAPSKGTSAKVLHAQARTIVVVLHERARNVAAVRAGVNDRDAFDDLGFEERVVAVAAQDQVDARNATRQLAIERKPDVRENHQRFAGGHASRVVRDRIPRVEETATRRLAPRAALRVLHDQQPQHVDADSAGGVEHQRPDERELAAFGVQEVRAHERVVHARTPRAQERKEIVKFAIADRLGIVAGRVDLRHDRFVPVVNRLTPAQRIAAIEEQSGPLGAQLAQARRETATIV